MKLLLDQNLSFRLVKKLNDVFPQTQQVQLLSLENASDRQIWDFARAEGYTIVTFDADFNDLATLYGHPPKIIWLRFGNTSTDNIMRIFMEKKQTITEFLTHAAYQQIACLEIN